MEQVSQSQTVLRDVFGYQEFRVGQEEVINAVLEGKDSLVIMPTGAVNHCVIKFQL